MSITQSKLFNFTEVFQTGKVLIKGNCTISNFKKGDKIIPNPFVIRKTGKELSINGFATHAYKDIAKIAAIFAKLTAMDNNSEDFTQADLRMAKRDYTSNKSIWESLGVVSFRYDGNSNVANIKTDDGELLHIEFNSLNKVANNLYSKEAVQGNKSVESTKNNAPLSTSKQNQTIDAAKKCNVSTSKSQKTSAGTKSSKTQKSSKSVDDVISTFHGGNIDIEDVKDLKSIARYTGISEKYIKDILVGIEGRKNWPITTAEYDGVPGQNCPRGRLTIGFGHTSLAGPPEVTPGMRITEKQAYQILANDIIQAKILAKSNAGDLYDKSPKSIRNAMIDLVFNKGPRAINEHLIANLQKGWYGSAALRTWYKTDSTGLKKRNLYRFIEACRDLQPKDRQSCIKRFYNEHKNNLQEIFKKDNDAKIVWNNFCKKNKSEKFSYK